MREPKTASTSLEEQYHAQGFRHIAGLDEVGRGAWAGPVVAAAVVLPPELAPVRESLRGVRDSKTINSMKARFRLADAVRLAALGWGIGEASVQEIAEVNVLNASKRAMVRALESLRRDFPAYAPEMLLLDHVRLEAVALPQVSYARMDSLSLTVAAASLLAKTHRDALMIELDAQYPGYGFAQNKGYAATTGSDAHRAGLDRLGPCPAHRMSFKPLQRRLL